MIFLYGLECIATDRKTGMQEVFIWNVVSIQVGYESDQCRAFKLGNG